MECDDGAPPPSTGASRRPSPHPSPVKGPRESCSGEYVGVDAEGAGCPSGTCSEAHRGRGHLPGGWHPLAAKQGGRQGSLCAVGVGLHYLAVHGHREGQAQDLRGHGGWVGAPGLSGATEPHPACGRPAPPWDGPPPLAIWVHHNHLLSPAGIVGTSGLLGLSPRPASPWHGQPGLCRRLHGGCIVGPLPPPHLPGPSTLPLAHSSNCNRVHLLWLRTQERWLP